MNFKRNDYKFFTKAYLAAITSDYKKENVGCTVYHKQIIVSICNFNKTNPLQYFYNKYRERTSNLIPKLHSKSIVLIN